MNLDLDTLLARARQRFNSGDYDGAWTFVRAAQAQVGDEAPPELLRLLGNLTAEFGDIAGGVALLDQALDGFRLADDCSGEALAAGNLTALLQRIGPVTRARALVERALVLTDPHDVDQRSRLLNVAANVAILQGRAADALDMARHAREHAEGRVACWAELTTAMALEHLGRYAEAGAAIERAAGLIAPDDLVNNALLRTSRAWLHILQQSFDRAWEACGHALACVGPQRHQWLYYPALAMRGVLLRESGQFVEAEVTLREAAVWPHRTGDLSAIISIEWHFAALYHTQNNEQCTAEHLAAGLNAMRRGEFVTALLWQPARVAKLCRWAIEQGIEASYATWILHSMAVVDAETPVKAVVQPDARLAQLTPREREVLELAADGLRDAEIARRLHLSVRTVHNHLQRCYEKLGVHSRAEAIQHTQQEMNQRLV